MPKTMPKSDKPDDPPLSQLDKFKAAARELGTDDDPERFKERVKKVAGAGFSAARVVRAAETPLPDRK